MGPGEDWFLRRGGLVLLLYSTLTTATLFVVLVIVLDVLALAFALAFVIHFEF